MMRIACLTLACAVLAACTAVPTRNPGPVASAQPYFPEELSLEKACPASAFIGSEAILDEYSNAWYSRVLRAAGEPSLSAEQRTLGQGAQIVRFIWLRSFHSPVIVRVALPATGRATAVATALSYAPTDKLETVVRQASRRLDPAETARVRRMLDDRDLRAIAGPACTGPALDGSRWIIERADALDYHFVERQSVHDGPLYRAGLSLLELTGWTFREIY